MDHQETNEKFPGFDGSPGSTGDYQSSKLKNSTGPPLPYWEFALMSLEVKMNFSTTSHSDFPSTSPGRFLNL